MHILEPATDTHRLSTQVYTHLPSRGEQIFKKWIQYSLEPWGLLKKRKKLENFQNPPL